MTPRSTPWVAASGTAAAFLVALGAGILVLLVLSPSPLGTLSAFFTGPFSSGLALGNGINEALLLTLTGLGAALAFGSGAFNLGGEGQIALGGLTVLALSLVLPPVWGLFGALLLLVAATAVSGALSGLSGLLRSRFHADEMITTFLLSAAVLPLVDALMTAPGFSDASSQMIQSRAIPSAFWLPGLLAPSSLNIGVFLALPLVAVFGVLVNRTVWGYRLRLVGRNREFARYAGVSVRLYRWLPLVLSGGLQGLAGALAVLGTQHAVVQGFSSGWGWNGVAVALIARTNPWFVLPAAVLLAFLDQASRWVVLGGSFPFQLSALFQAFILFFITAQVIPLWRRR